MTGYLRGETITKLAADIGINRGTAHNWLKDPVFRAELYQRQADLEDSLDRLIEVESRKSIVALADARDHPNTTTSAIVISAAGKLLSYQAKVRQYLYLNRVKRDRGVEEDESGFTGANEEPDWSEE
jgi:hypothetical protein